MVSIVTFIIGMVLLFVLGILIGAGLTYFLTSKHQKTAEQLAAEFGSRAQQEKVRELELMLGQVKDSFGNLSMQALEKSTRQFIQLANKVLEDRSRLSEEQIEGKKKLIDQTLVNMKEELSKVQEMVQKIEAERKQSFGAITMQLKQSVEQTQRLQEITNQLSTALSHSQTRGQWGERMAEDVLRMAGFIEGINYLKQTRIQGSDKRPDFTFLLPQNLKVNMDVKFPLTNYLAYLKAETDQEKEHYKHLFLKDVRQRIKEVTTRDYINPSDNTVDYVIVFIPNEQVYAFINEHDSTVLDEALKNKVILSSPITLYAVLAVIRQAVDNFRLEQTAAQILSLLNDFRKQWDRFKESMEKMGKKLDEAKGEYNRLVTTRTTQLERPLRKIEGVRISEHLKDSERPELPGKEE
ncbi:MAG: DNA recombination protein RmuC [Calditrichaeota bacterium]|nr:DNA recombination protein RmuC [Calditrichota bacterium]